MFWNFEHVVPWHLLYFVWSYYSSPQVASTHHRQATVP
jgi:hypothetical protein